MASIVTNWWPIPSFQPRVFEIWNEIMINDIVCSSSIYDFSYYIFGILKPFYLEKSSYCM